MLSQRNDVCPWWILPLLLVGSAVAAYFGQVTAAILLLAAAVIIFASGINWKLLVDKWIDHMIRKETLRSQLDTAMRQRDELGKK